MPWVDLSQAAFTLGVSERTIRNWIKSGKLHARSVDGRREVEIPEPEDAGADQIFPEDEEEASSPFAIQKRLEVALLECGRVKGTLASQERIMENLSANISELNVKLQKSQGAIWQRTLITVIVAFLAIGIWLLTTSSHKQEISAAARRHSDDRDRLKDNHHIEIEANRKEADKQRKGDLVTQETKLKGEHDKTMAAREKIMTARVADLRSVSDGLREDMKVLRKDLEEVRASRTKLATESLILQKSLDALEKENTALKNQVLALEKAKQETAEMELKLRREAMGGRGSR